LISKESKNSLDLYVKSSGGTRPLLSRSRVEADVKNSGPMQRNRGGFAGIRQRRKSDGHPGEVAIPMIDAGEHEVIGKLLNELAASLPGRIEPLEWLVELYGRRATLSAYQTRSHIWATPLSTDGQLERAKQVFEQLVDREPESDSAKRKLNYVLRKMGLISAEDTPEGRRRKLAG